MPTGWSRIEVEATVASYFDMLRAEMSGVQYNKSEHRRKLLPLLSNRSEGSVEFKFANITAILMELRFPNIPGYKPRSNYQNLLFEVVADRLREMVDLQSIAERDTAHPIEAMPYVDDILQALTDPPKPVELKNRVAMPRARYSAQPINYLELEARNQSLGLAGEEFTINFERARLIKAGREKLASRIEHVAKTQGDGAGFDILSFEESGTPRLIEVKTTKYGAQSPFFVSRNELEVSKSEANNYYLYRLYDFRVRPYLFTLRGALSSTCKLDPTSYAARVS